uniref:Uncharacterized protein n=1 Tax=Vespula pensylvanica TaxID=30213 RepID=A0A834UB87_VESPE|nr:hypothetical protein H0235_007121 [Vespula pensylvanica]
MSKVIVLDFPLGPSNIEVISMTSTTEKGSKQGRRISKGIAALISPLSPTTFKRHYVGTSFEVASPLLNLPLSRSTQPLRDATSLMDRKLLGIGMGFWKGVVRKESRLKVSSSINPLRLLTFYSITLWEYEESG